MSTPSRFATILLAGLLACSSLARTTPALAVSDDAVLKRMDDVLEENARLKEETWKLHKSQNREAARQASEALAASEERLERTRAEALAHVSGVSPAQVEALRKDGKSWGQASGELGVHPGFLGIDKTPLYESRSTRKAKSSKAATKKGARGKAQVVAQEPTRTGKKTTAAAKAKGPTKAKVQQKGKGKPKKPA